MSNPSQVVGVALVRSVHSLKAADALPSNPNRASQVHALIDAFGFGASMDIIEPAPLTNDELTRFHSEEYIACLLPFGENKDDGDALLDRFGLLYDCPLFDGIEDYVRYIAGGTVTAANALVTGQAHIAIHWEGGRHHCKRNKAAGFCYVNDIVLGILRLQTQFARVLYIDLDLHHGDGVQDAFIYSDKVMTLSIHHYDRGFYPNTGGSFSEGKGRGVGRSINIPLNRGASDASFTRVFSAIASRVATSFAPEAVVVQCGCDGLADDPYKIFNLTTDAFACALELVLSWGLPVILLGGGGYNNSDCARCWARLTAVACGADILPATDIPEHTFLNQYTPAFDMRVEKMFIDDANTESAIDALIAEAEALL
ncbi:histone deacetylase 8-like protein [Coemansia spiralis]|nr:histone deacetylase 8-like protein [Coemansia spiralis]